MTTATITITINKFRALGSVFPISATMAMPATPGATFDGESITITAPGPAQLTFSLPSNQYVLLGVSFVANTPYNGGTDLGRGEFPLVTITRSNTAGSNLTVDDQNYNELPYDYVLLVQSVSDGSIGLIDPFIRYQPL